MVCDSNNFIANRIIRQARKTVPRRFSEKRLRPLRPVIFDRRPADGPDPFAGRPTGAVRYRSDSLKRQLG